MSGGRGTRASDRDRERTAAALGRHYAAGRLTLEEFQERLDRAYAAKTLGELDDLMTDLPETDLRQLDGQPGGNPPLPERRAPGTVQVPAGRYSAAWRFWLGITVIAFVIWLASGAAGGPWFLWALVPLGFILLRRWSGGAGHRTRGHNRDRP